jgi:adenylate cyclase
MREPASGRRFPRSPWRWPVGFEIERKFLVRGAEWRNLATGTTSIRQAYLAGDGKASVRVRIENDTRATLSIKSRPVDLRRLELEYPIPIPDAEALMPLRLGCVIRKIRHVVPWHELAWEIDVFEDDNAGLVLAEIELRHESQHVDLPAWIGREVTGQPQFYNSFLMQRPFSTWSPDARMGGESLP